MGKEARRKRSKRRKANKTSKNEAAADPNTGRSIHFDAATADALRNQFAAFEERFGRPPGPHDPVFVDDDADVPIPLTAVKAEAVVVGAMTEAGIDAAMIYAYQQTGFVVTEINLESFNDEDRQQWADAVARYRRLHGENPGLDAAPDADPRALVTLSVCVMIDHLLTDDAKSFFAAVDKMPVAEDDGITVAYTFAVLAELFFAVRENPTVDDAAIDAAIAAAVAQASALSDPLDAVGDLLRRDATATVAEMVVRVGDDQVMVVAMLVLAAALASELDYGHAAALFDAFVVGTD